MSAYIKTLKNTDGDIIYPQTKTSAVYTNEGVNIESIFGNPALIDGSAPIIDTTMSVDADTLQGKNWGQMLTNRNLLDNWDFRNPVNQRGQTSYTSGYAIDRWFLTGTATLTANNGNITVSGGSGGGSLRQIIETELEQAIYTLSFNVSAVSGSANYLVLQKNGGDYDTPVTKPLSVGITSGSGTPNASAQYVAIVDLGANASVDLVSVKLELGAVSTLANDPPADYGTELAKCQRYCIMYGQYAQWLYTDIQSNYIDFTIQIPVSMRTTSSIINSNNFMILEQTGFSFSVVAQSGNNIRFRATKSGHGLTLARLEITGLGGFSADL